MPKVGTHRSDRRFKDDSGVLWASQWEHDVYHGLRSAGYRVRKCDESDSIGYTSRVKQGRCLECSSQEVVQDRVYTADLYVVESKPGEHSSGPYLVECKGFFAREKRSLFTSVAKELAVIGKDLRIIFQSNRKLKGTKQTPVSYIHKYCKNVIPGVWDAKTNTVTWYERNV